MDTDRRGCAGPRCRWRGRRRLARRARPAAGRRRRGAPAARPRRCARGRSAPARPGRPRGVGPAKRRRSSRRRRRRCMSSTCISRPSRMIATRSATCSTSERTWPEKITVWPSARAWLTRPSTSLRAEGSSAEVGSSRIRMLDRVGEGQRQRELLLHAGREGPDPSPEVEPHDPLGDGHRPLEPDAAAEVAEVVRAARAPHRAGQAELARQVRDPPTDLQAAAASSRGRRWLARPAVGRSRPSNRRIVVVLPEPFGPSNPKTSPLRTSSDTSWSAGPSRSAWSIRPSRSSGRAPSGPGPPAAPGWLRRGSSANAVVGTAGSDRGPAATVRDRGAGHQYRRPGRRCRAPRPPTRGAPVRSVRLLPSWDVLGVSQVSIRSTDQGRRPSAVGPLSWRLRASAPDDLSPSRRRSWAS